MEIFCDVICFLSFVSIPRVHQKLQMFSVKTNNEDFSCYIEEIRKVIFVKYFNHFSQILHFPLNNGFFGICCIITFLILPSLSLKTGNPYSYSRVTSKGFGRVTTALFCTKVVMLKRIIYISKIVFFVTSGARSA